MKNKLIPYIGALLLGVFSLSSCDNGFEEMNENPNAVLKPDPKSMFTLAEVYMNGQDYSHTRTNNLYTSQFVQHFAQPGSSGSIYVWSGSLSGAIFGETYGKGLNQTFQLMSVIPQTDEYANMNQACRIMKAYMFQRLTDAYGEIPYFEAGKGYNGNIFAPKYDTQKAIYDDLLKELDQASDALDASKPFVTNADLFYKGDIAKWKKFANSLLLRVAMRISNVDPALSKQYVEKAVAKGVFDSNEDNLILQHEANPQGVKTNPITSTWVIKELNGGDCNIKYSKTFIDQLKNNNDPRLRILAKLEATGDNNPAHQEGLDNGALEFPNGGNKKLISDPNTSTVLRTDAPTIIMHNAEVQFLLAEAAQKGWNVNGTTKVFYENGVKSAMQMLTVFGNKVPSVTDAEYNTYITARPFDVSKALEQIGTQKWISLLFNGYEAYAEYRRTGFPILTPVNHPGSETNGTIPRRLIYDQSELITNPSNYKEAIQRQGPDLLTTRIWWDKK